MKITKYKYKTSGIAIVNGEPVATDEKEETYYFALTHGAIRTFESIAGVTISKAMIAISKNDDDAFSFIRSIAACAYQKVVDGALVCNEATAEEFMQKDFYYKCAFDESFVSDMMDMLLDFMPKPAKVTDQNAKKKQ